MTWDAPVKAKRWAPPVASAVILCSAGVAWAEGAEGKPYGDLGQALMLLAVFALVLLVLGKFAWKPIISQLQRREKEIGERQGDTERRLQEAKDLEAHHRARLARAEAEAKQLLAKSLEEAARAREQMLAGAREEGNQAVEAAKAEIEQFKKGALEELQQAMAGLAVDIAGEIIREELSAERQSELEEQSLRRIRDRAAKGAE
ncbi:MAG TPA: F0F1 ATP synthase subunit B [Phycisphaerae bacterium]|nr:F0F1 ATP synthase subunit B [Phycisphaerae bacterium]